MSSHTPWSCDDTVGSFLGITMVSPLVGFEFLSGSVIGGLVGVFPDLVVVGWDGLVGRVGGSVGSRVGRV